MCLIFRCHYDISVFLFSGLSYRMTKVSCLIHVWLTDAKSIFDHCWWCTTHVWYAVVELYFQTYAMSRHDFIFNCINQNVIMIDTCRHVRYINSVILPVGCLDFNLQGTIWCVDPMVITGFCLLNANQCFTPVPVDLDQGRTSV